MTNNIPCINGATGQLPAIIYCEVCGVVLPTDGSVGIYLGPDSQELCAECYGKFDE